MTVKSADIQGWIEIARTGRFQDAGGTYHDFSRSRLEKIAAAYEPKRGQAPLVIGHPALNGPAHGWIEALKINGDKLLAKPAYVTAEIKRAVDNGLYKYVSMSLYKDDRLRHVGILGGHPPAIDGLAPISFAGEAALTIGFSGAPEPKPDEPQAKGTQMSIEELTRQLAETQAKLSAALQEKETVQKEAAALKEELAKFKTEADKLKTEAEKTTAEFSAYRDKQEKAILAGRIDVLVKDGKVPPSEKEAVSKTAEALRQAGALNFADGTENPLESYLGSLAARRPSELFQNFSAPGADDGSPAAAKPLSAKL